MSTEIEIRDILCTFENPSSHRYSRKAICPAAGIVTGAIISIYELGGGDFLIE